jgi:short subunit dehydrogenase-like uncharacterized protein
MIDRHHEAARRKGVRIVHCCGFDSIPSDLGAWMVRREAERRFGSPPDRIESVVLGADGGFSGGTLASLSEVARQAAEDPEVRRILSDPYALNPPDRRHGPGEGAQRGARFDEALGAWTAPFVMAPINERIVRRSDALLREERAPTFRYRESVRTQEGWFGALLAWGIALGSAAFVGAMSVAPTRRLLERFVLPEAGDGPSEASIESGYFAIRVRGEGETSAGEAFSVEAKIAADRDPGYGATSKMLGESALCLAVDEPGEESLAGGVLTPASAMAEPLVERLRRVGLTFETTRVEGPESA